MLVVEVSLDEIFLIKNIIGGFFIQIHIQLEFLFSMWEVMVAQQIITFILIQSGAMKKIVNIIITNIENSHGRPMDDCDTYQYIYIPQNRYLGLFNCSRLKNLNTNCVI